VDVRSRRRLVLELLDALGEVTVAELSERAGVSDMTVRRDLEALEREGLLKRVHGGAIGIESLSHEPPFASRAERAVDAKARIGRAAASLLADGETVILDVGSTTLEVAKALRERQGITLLTPSLRIAAILADRPGIRLVVTGGVVRVGELSLVGDLAERAFDNLLFDTFVMGVAGVAPAVGCTEFNLDDARVKRAALARSRRCVVVADSSKLGKAAFARICPLERVDVLVTDGQAPEEALSAVRAADVEVVVV
jgi:DeoR/GlpR family transcriptional regulator of sugar metabolism